MPFIALGVAMIIVVATIVNVAVPVIMGPAFFAPVSDGTLEDPLEVPTAKATFETMVRHRYSGHGRLVSWRSVSRRSPPNLG